MSRAAPTLGVALFLAVFLAGPLAEAAPTCLDKAVNTIRCGAQGAMPVAWQPSPQAVWEHNSSKPETQLGPLLDVIGAIALLLALIALLPEFDGTHPEDWDRQEGDDP